MRDLTEAPIGGHILQMALPIAAGMVFQTLYFLIDLYFVARIGPAALAGVGAAGNLTFLVFAATQVLGVGTVALIAHASGRKDRPDAVLVFNQSLVMAATCAALTLLVGYLVASPYMRAIGADAATAAAGLTYLRWFLPNLALQFAMAVMGSTLRGTGIVKPTMIVQVVSVALNALLAPVLIAGWGTGVALGTAGAGLASSLAVAVGVVMLVWYFHRLEHFVGFVPALWRPRAAAWWRLLRVGLPAGGEFALMFVFMAAMYGLIRRFGPETQAGYGVGSRIMQSMFLPAMAVSFAAAPIIGQNFAAGRHARAREAFWLSAAYGAVIMVLLTGACQWRAPAMVGWFTADPTARAVGAQFLQIVSWNFAASGFIFTCSALFQGLGNTLPSLVSSSMRIVSFLIPAFWLASRPEFQPRQLWMVSVASMSLQAAVSLWLVLGQFRARLPLQSTIETGVPTDASG